MTPCENPDVPSGRCDLDPDIRDLDLEPVAFLVALTEGWTLEKLDAVELEYRCWLQLVRDHACLPIVPGRDCDAFWHAHILTLGLYLEHCQQLFGGPLLHWPFSGALGEADAAEQRARFEESRCLLSELKGRVQSTRIQPTDEGDQL